MSKRARALKIRLMFYGGFLALLWGAYLWQPYEYDWIPRTPPNPNPPVDPDSKFLLSGKAKVLIVTAHPDDSSFFTGGLLLRLSYAHTEIHQIICTDGDKGYYPFEDWRENRRVRRKEALAESRAWGGRDILFLGRPDGRLRVTPEMVDRIAEEIRQIKPDYLICFDGAYPQRMTHQDHRRSGDAAWLAVKQTGLPMWIMMFQTGAPNYIADISDEWDAQQDLLAIHRSQFYGQHLNGVINMVGDTASDVGARAGFNYGEGFRCVRL